MDSSRPPSRSRSPSLDGVDYSDGRPSVDRPGPSAPTSHMPAAPASPLAAARRRVVSASRVFTRRVHTASSSMSSLAPPPAYTPRVRNIASNVISGPVDKPWQNLTAAARKRERRTAALVRYLFIAMVLLGVAGAGALVYFSYVGVPRLGNVCLVLSDDFNGETLDSSVWNYEVQVGGYGNGEFEWTTPAGGPNTKLEDGLLYIVPTLTADAIPGGAGAVVDGANITIPGCTGRAGTSDCIATSNATAGTVINPVQSARISTRGTKSIRYGRVEVRAKMPTGDWLWPAIWMLPVNDTYGPWPRSGEIDIVEARGNGPNYGGQGSDWLTSTLHWGPSSFLDAFWRTVGWWEDKHHTFDAGWHVYTLEWDENFLWTYVDSRINRIFEVKLNKPLFPRGRFPQTISNGSGFIALDDPWGGKPGAPFDQPFYLIMDVAVGGTNGWFPDGVSNKPWVDGSATAMRDFTLAQSLWYPTWPSDFRARGLGIDYVRMYERC